MKKMRKGLAVTLLAAMTMSLTACGGSGAGEETNDTSGSVLVQIAYENNPGEPIDLAAQEWQRLVEEKSGGTMEVELFPSSQLGSKSDLTDQMLMGEPIITISDGSALAEYGAPEMSILCAPYIFDEWDDYMKLRESDWWAEQEELLEASGLHIITSNWIFGERHIMSTKPIHSIDDLKGVILRAPDTQMYMKSFEALGAAPTAMAWGDCYTALQQGTIDALENTLTTLYAGGFGEIAKNLTLTSHVRNASQWICGQSWWETLTEEQQNILIEAGDEAGLKNNELEASTSAESKTKMEEQGVTIIELSDEELAGFADAALSLYGDSAITANWRDDLYNYIKEIID